MENSREKDAEKKLQNFLQGRLGFQNATKECIKVGTGQVVFKVTNDGEFYIAHVASRADAINTTLATARALGYLTHLGVEFAPKLMAHDIKSEVVMESFVSGEYKKYRDYSEDQLEKLAGILHQLSKCSASLCIEYCEEHDLGKPKLITALESLQIYGRDRFEIAKQTCPDKEILKWLEERLVVNEAYVQSLRNDMVDFHLCHGDACSSNVLLDGEKIVLIDWEHARLVQGTELPYIYIHGGMRTEQFEKFVGFYAKISGQETEDLWYEIRQDERIIRLNDVIWAAMMWGETKDLPLEQRIPLHRKGRGTTYEELARERMELFEKLD